MCNKIMFVTERNGRNIPVRDYIEACRPGRHCTTLQPKVYMLSESGQKATSPNRKRHSAMAALSGGYDRPRSSSRGDVHARRQETVIISDRPSSSSPSHSATPVYRVVNDNSRRDREADVTYRSSWSSPRPTPAIRVESPSASSPSRPSQSSRNRRERYDRIEVEENAHHRSHSASSYFKKPVVLYPADPGPAAEASSSRHRNYHRHRSPTKAGSSNEHVIIMPSSSSSPRPSASSSSYHRRTTYYHRAPSTSPPPVIRAEESPSHNRSRSCSRVRISDSDHYHRRRRSTTPEKEKHVRWGDEPPRRDDKYWTARSRINDKIISRPPPPAPSSPKSILKNSPPALSVRRESPKKGLSSDSSARSEARKSGRKHELPPLRGEMAHWPVYSR